MSYLKRASVVASSVAGVVAVLGISQAVGLTTQSASRYSDAAYTSTAMTPKPATHRGAAHRHHAKHHHLHRTHHSLRLVLPSDYAAWSKVATCEESGWHTPGGEYPDSIGINITNYEAFGGKPQPAGTPTLAERAEQIQVADRLIHSYGVAVPDQYGCGGGW